MKLELNLSKWEMKLLQEEEETREVESKLIVNDTLVEEPEPVTVKKKKRSAKVAELSSTLLVF